MHHRTALFILLATLTMGWPAHAQTLAHALDLAWSRHPMAAAEALNQSAAQARTQLSDHLTPGPATLSLSTLNDQPGANRGKEEWELEVETPLWLPGQREAARSEATAAHKELDAQQRLLRWQLAGELRESWWALAHAQSLYALAVTRHTTAQQLWADVERRTRIGELARVDLNLAQVEQLAAQAEVDDAQAALQQATQGYQQLTGVLPPQLLAPETPMLTPPDLAEHPQIQATAAATLGAQAKFALAQQSQREAPTLAVRMVRDRSDFADTYADAFGIKLTIPFSLDGRVRQSLDSNRAQLAMAQAEYEQARRRVTLAQETAHHQLKASQRQLELATQRATLTQDNLKLMEKSFALGESDLATLLRARAAHFDAQALLQKGQINVRAAVSRLNQSIGVLP